MSADGTRPALDVGLGELLISVMVAAALWGIGTAQCYWYYLGYPKDRRSLKVLVFAVWTADTFHQALIVQSLYFYLIQNFSNSAALDIHTWPLAVQVLAEAIISTLAQAFFIFRIWKLSQGNYLLVVIPSAGALAKLAVSFVYMVRGLGLHSLTVDLHKQHPVSLTIYSTAAVTDIMIAVIMTYLLYTSKSASRLSSGIVNRLMLYTINTGLITSLSSILSLVLAASMTNNVIFAAVYFVNGRLYVNTMLASLNARKSIARRCTNSLLEFKMDTAMALSVSPYARTAGTVVTCEPTTTMQSMKVHDSMTSTESEDTLQTTTKL